VVQTRFVAITDDDSFVARDWLLNTTRQLVREPGAIVTGHVELVGDDQVAFSVVTASEPK
jgi:hypothetical protein